MEEAEEITEVLGQDMMGGLADDDELMAELDELEAECVSDRHCHTRKAELSWAVLVRAGSSTHNYWISVGPWRTKSCPVATSSTASKRRVISSEPSPSLARRS